MTRNRSTPDDTHFTVTCPVCAAAPRKQCRTLKTGKLTEPHMGRLKAQYPTCRDCGCQEATHPIATCRTFKAPASEQPFVVGFHVVRESYYWPVMSEQWKAMDKAVLNIGLFSTTGGGCRWEFVIDEEEGGALRLKVFDGAWVAFTQIPEFFESLAGLGRSAEVEDVVELMASLGYRDFTKRVAEEHAFRSGSRS